MKRKNIVTIHIMATLIAIATISTFFTISLIAEIIGDEDFIRSVKEFIFYALPIMVLAMPTLKLTGEKLAGNFNSSLILVVSKRMKFVLMNGMVLISLAIFLYYRSHFKEIDSIFLIAQIAEFIFGLFNLILIIINAKTGMQLSGKLKGAK